jgi:hypothetical protein
MRYGPEQLDHSISIGALAGVGAGYYSWRMRQGTSEDRFPAGRSRTPAADRQAAALTTRRKPGKSDSRHLLEPPTASVLFECRQIRNGLLPQLPRIDGLVA